jgi:hypothetical protein
MRAPGGATAKTPYECERICTARAINHDNEMLQTRVTEKNVPSLTMVMTLDAYGYRVPKACLKIY